MITYGHEEFIREAIEGVLMQQGDFDLELIISNDCSPDTTDEVIQDILNHHTQASKIVYIRHDKNIGMMPNFIFALQQCKEKYVALCEGDDYWTDPHKLQKQIDFLEANQEYVACFHNADVVENQKVINDYCYIPEDCKIDAKEIIMKGGGIFPTASLMYRNVVELPDFAVSTKAGDTALAFTLLKAGDFYYMNQKMCNYRKHSGGSYTSIQQDKSKKLLDIKSNLALLNNFRKYHKPVFNEFFDEAIQRQLLRISNTLGFFSVVKPSVLQLVTWKDIASFIRMKIKKKI